MYGYVYVSVCSRGAQREERTKLFIYLPPPGPPRVLSGPAVTLRDYSIAHCVFLGDIGYVTVLSPTVTSIISVSVPATSMVTLYHSKCHFGLLLASGFISQKPFVSDAEQTSKGAKLG